MIENPRPTFIVAGGVRCATGWIRECVSEHPDIYMQPKETHYFDLNYENGGEWYNQFFRDNLNRIILGEKTASYLHCEEVALRIKNSLPNVKLIFCLRDPISRMYSHYMMSASGEDALKQKGFIKSVESEPKFIEWGKYSKQLSVFLSKIPRHNILIKLYEDIEKDPYGFLSEIYSFVGADPKFKAPSTQLRTKLGQLEYNSLFWRSISKIMLHPRAPLTLRSMYTSIRPEENNSILTDKVYKLYSGIFRDDIFQLEEILSRDLGMWRTKRFLKN